MSVTNHINCADCRRPMTGVDGVEICRRNGLPTSAANADGCKHFEPKDADSVWLAGGWHLDGGCCG